LSKNTRELVYLDEDSQPLNFKELLSKKEDSKKERYNIDN